MSTDIKFGEELFKAILAVRKDNEHIDGFGGNLPGLVWLLANKVKFELSEIPTFKDNTVFVSKSSCLPYDRTEQAFSNVEQLKPIRKALEEHFKANPDVLKDFAHFDSNVINPKDFVDCSAKYPDNEDLKLFAKALSKAVDVKEIFSSMKDNGALNGIDVENDVEVKKAFKDNLSQEDFEFLSKTHELGLSIHTLFWRFMGIDLIVTMCLDVAFSI